MLRVSVIIPAYNPGPYLDVAIQSVLAQSFKDWELIIVDDGSTEDLSYVDARYPAVRRIQQQNQGQSVARNTGIAQSSGEYIAFLDQDDIWLPTKLEKQITVMEEDAKIGFCHTQFDLIDSEGVKIEEGFGRQQSYTEMLNGSGVCGSTTVMVRRSCLSGVPFNTFYEPAEDYDLWLRLTRDYQGVFVTSVEALYRKHETNQSRRYRSSHQAINKILLDHGTKAKQNQDWVAARAANVGIQNIRPTYGGQAFDHARESFRKRALIPFVSHLFYALTHSPEYVIKSLLYHRIRKM